MLTYGSVCSGIEAASVAWEPLGWTPAWFAEIEPFPSAVLAHHYPRVPNLGDMTKLASYVRAGIVAAPDVLVGGTPCQAYSLAGLRGGLADPRGQLTLSYVDLANAIDEKRPTGDECVIYWENVPGVLSDKGNAFGHFLAGLAGESEPLVPPRGGWSNAGLVYGPQRAIAWRILDAQYFGVAQRRRRLFVVASARPGFNPAALLFESDGVRRDSPPSRETRQDAAGAAAARAAGGSIAHRDVMPTMVSGGSTSESHGKMSGQFSEQYIVPVVGALNCGSGEACDNTVFSSQLICMAHGQGGAEISVGQRPTLTCNHEAPIVLCVHSDTVARTGEALTPSVDAAGRSRLRNPGMGILEDGTSYGLTTGAPHAVLGLHVDAQPDEMRFDPHVSASLTCSQKAGVLTQLQYRWRVRRLMPIECERLQAFPDGYTLVPYRGKPACDGPRYKALGNSMCTTNMRWLGVRLILTHPEIFDAKLRRAA